MIVKAIGSKCKVNHLRTIYFVQVTMHIYMLFIEFTM